MFFLTLSHGFGNSVSLSKEQFFVVENQDEKQSSNEDLFPEFDEQEDVGFIDIYVSCGCFSAIKELIYPKEFPFCASCDFTFWQPPQNS